MSNSAAVRPPKVVVVDRDEGERVPVGNGVIGVVEQRLADHVPDGHRIDHMQPHGWRPPGRNSVVAFSVTR